MKYSYEINGVLCKIKDIKIEDLPINKLEKFIDLLNSRGNTTTVLTSIKISKAWFTKHCDSKILIVTPYYTDNQYCNKHPSVYTGFKRKMCQCQECKFLVSDELRFL